MYVSLMYVLANENQGTLHSVYTQTSIKTIEVHTMYETDQKTIKELFYQQISELTKKTNSFDYQFSDRWTPVYGEN